MLVMNNKKMLISENRWLDLPQEIMELIMKRLFYADLLNFRAVCKSWNSINRGGTVPSKQSPWLLMFEKVDLKPPPGASYSDFERVISWRRNSKGCSCKLFDPVYKKTYSTINMNTNININFSLIENVYASKHGWILSSAKYLGLPRCSLLFAYTPFSNVNNFIKLPTLFSCRIEFATFTSNPSITTDDQEKNCLFVVLRDSNRLTSNNYVIKVLIISTCRPGEKSWSSRCLRYSLPVSEFDSYTGGDERWIYSEGNLYYIIHPGKQQQQLAGQQIRTVRVVKWELSLKTPPFYKLESGQLVYSPLNGSVMNKELDHEDDLLSKLEKDHFSIPNEFKVYSHRTAGTEYESCNSTTEYESCNRGKMVKIAPPHY